MNHAGVNRAINGASKDTRKLIRTALKAGWRSRFNGGHVILYPPTGPAITCSITANRGKRGGKNLRADLRRAGLDV